MTTENKSIILKLCLQDDLLVNINKLSLEDLKNDGSDDPEMEMTPGRFVDHIGDKGEEFLKEYEAILKKLNE